MSQRPEFDVRVRRGAVSYDEPVLTGMVATTFTVDGPDVLRHGSVEAPPTNEFELPGAPAPLQVWDGSVDFVMDVWADSTLAKAIAERAPSRSRSR